MKKQSKSADVVQPVRNWRKPTVYPSSKTIPGQSLRPGELLKRHQAGTLPDIDLSSKYEYHYDENGKQVSVPLPIEMHELHKYALKYRKRQEELVIEKRKADAEAQRKKIIEEYLKDNPQLDPRTAASGQVDPGTPGEPAEPVKG